MNQQLIFNHDYEFDHDRLAVRCSVLQGGLRLQVYIRMPDGWSGEAWLSQVREDCFFWEDEIELAVKIERFEPDAVIWLEGAA
jgi:hypothetical protein